MLTQNAYSGSLLQSLFPGRVGSCSLLKYSPGELRWEVFQSRSGRSAVGRLWGLLESESASRQETVVEPGACWSSCCYCWSRVMRFSCSVHRCLSVCYSGSSHQPSVTVSTICELRAWGRCQHVVIPSLILLQVMFLSFKLWFLATSCGVGP